MLTEEPFENFFNLHYAAVINFFRRNGSREHSDDLAQETFLRLYRAWQGERDETQLNPRLLFTIAINLQRNAWRTINRCVPIERASNLISADDPQGTSLRNERHRIVRRVIDDLPDQMKRCLLLHLQDLNHKEIADLLQIRSGTVGAHLSQARQKLKVELASRFDDVSYLNQGAGRD